MRRFTLFTLLYFAAGVCFTAIAMQSADMTANLKTTLLVEAGLLYLFAVLSTFSFWRQAVLRSHNRVRDRSIWQQNFVAIAPWLVIVLVVIESISNLLGQNWTTEAIAKASLGLPIVLVCAENLLPETKPWNKSTS
ncbi:hypothetical protein [Nostoc sp.]|uniref:hypothetical protein n=1 Tax=Nostoc sp. TaxID=1180 RepID=UPI002FF652BA